MSDQPGNFGDPDVMTLSQAAALLRVPPADLMSAVREGTLPFHRGGSRVWFSRGELLASLRNPRPAGGRDDA